MAFWKSIAAALGMAAMGATTVAAAADRPIVFVHGDSDNAGLWMVQIWRFESNGYPRDLLFPVDLRHPQARGDDAVPEENRSSTTDVASELAGDVARVLITTKADKVDFVANSRGCQTTRNYLKNGGGKYVADTVVLAGCVHHGVFNNPNGAQGSEYNGMGKFLTQLNAGSEVEDGVKTYTIRSEKYDLYNQPMGDFIGMAGKPIGGSYTGPELKGATNITLPGIIDHRGTAYSPEAFKVIYKAITGKDAETIDVTPEEHPVLDGKVSGWVNGSPTNVPLAGAKVEIFKTDPKTGERMGEAVHTKTVGEDGMWGPFTADPKQTYEFVVTAEGYPVQHIYRSPFPRSYAYVNLRLYPKEGPELTSKSHVGMMRPRGYIGAERDTVTFDGNKADVPPGDVPHVWKLFKTFDDATPRTVVGSLNGETIAARSWPSDGNNVWIELTY
ncbi:MAG: hydrolase [Rhizobiaceae bacterium]